MRRSVRSPRRLIPVLVFVTGASFMVLPTTAAFADTTITPTGPLANIFTSSDLNCQVSRVDDPVGEFYGSAARPACGTLVATGGTLYGPAALDAGPPTTPYVPESQTNVTGSGTAADPYTVTTSVDTGVGGLQIAQTDTYVEGQDSYRTDVVITNTGESSASGILYRAGDCYLNGSDSSYGKTNAGDVACATSTGASAQILSFSPISAGSHYVEDTFNHVWSDVSAQADFPDTCLCSDNIDSGAGLSWGFNLTASASVTESSTITVTAPATSCEATPPDAPTNVQAFAGDASAALTWDAPVNDGGAPIESYNVNINDQTTAGSSTFVTPDSKTSAPLPAFTTQVSGTSAQITGLTNGDAYTFTVAATNCAGTGPASDPPAGPVTPAAGTSAEVIGPGNLSQTTGTPGVPPSPDDTTVGAQVFPSGSTGVGTLEELPPSGPAVMRDAVPVAQFCGGDVCLGNLLQAKLHNGTLGLNPRGVAVYRIKLFLDSSIVPDTGTAYQVWYDGNLSDDNDQSGDLTPPATLARCSGSFTGTPCVAIIHRTLTFDLKIVVRTSDVDPRLSTSK